MNEIRQLCTSSMSPEKHLDEIFEHFQVCPSEQTLASLSLICQSISCMSSEQLHVEIVQHRIFLLIRQWCERLLETWLDHQTFNAEEYRAMFYIHQLFKLIAEWFTEQNNEQADELIQQFFLDEHFLPLLARIIQQLIHTNIDHEDTDDILDVLYRSTTTFVQVYSDEHLVHQSLVDEHLTNCIFECFTSSSVANLFAEIPSIRTRFLLFTCLDYLIASNMSNELFPTIYQIFKMWCDLPKNFHEEISLLIIRVIRYFNQFSFNHRELIIRENLCSYLRPNFDHLCQTDTLLDDLVSLFINLASIPIGKEHLRQLGFLELIFDQIKLHPTFWQPLTLLLTQGDLYEASFLKRLMHLLILRTNNTLQTLSSTAHETSFDSMFSKHQLAVHAIDWFNLCRTEFLCYTIIGDELIHSTKKLRLIPMLIETILAIEQEEELSDKLIEAMLELLWTLTFDIDTKILLNHSQFHQWLKDNACQSTNIRLISQGILFLVRPNVAEHRRLSLSSNQLICMISTDECYRDLCVTLRDRLQIEQHYSVELIVTSKCQSIDSLMQLVHRSSLCLFCSSKRMKSDNLAHLISSYLTVQSQSIPLLAIRLEHDVNFEGNWLENLPLIDMPSILKEIRRYVTPPLSNFSRPKRVSRHPSHRHSWNYMQRSVHSWSTQDVNQWCEATQGRFESLRPLVMRLNGPALVHLAEILASEPAAMYHSLNDELLQRTGSTVPLTEYASLCSELQRLIRMKSTNSSFNLHSKKKKWTNTRFCTLF